MVIDQPDGLSTISVRRLAELTDDEIEQLSQILVDVVAEGASVGYLPPLSMETATDFWRKVTDPLISLLVAERSGQIVGTVQIERSPKPNARHRGEVNKLLVDPACQRQGIGRLLMDAVVEEARATGLRMLHLDTDAEDHSSVFYRTLGWTEVGTIPMWAEAPGGSIPGTTFYYLLIE